MHTTILEKLQKVSKHSLLLLAFGLMLITFSGYRYYTNRVLSFDYQPQTQAVNTTRLNRITIEKVGVDLTIEPAEIINGVWQISEDSATHLASSGAPGEGENIVIYAHNKNNLFGPIRWLSLEDSIRIYTDDGNVHDYDVIRTETVDPEFISPVLPKDEEVLTLYTCTGFLDSKRFVVYARPVNQTTPK